MPVSNYGTNYLMGVLPDLKVTPQHFIDRYYRKEVTSDKEEIDFDVVSRKRKLAPFVLPTSQGQIVNPRGYQTKSFKPAYVKPKIPMDFNRALKRMAGEAFTGSMTAAQRQDLLVMEDLADLQDMVRARWEWMAIQPLLNGSVTVVGDGYPSVTVDFGRDAALTVTLTAGDRWNQSGSTPWTDLTDLANTVFVKSGSRPRDVIMEAATTWDVFSGHIDVKEHLTLTQVTGQALALDLNQPIETGAVYMGSAKGFNFWQYSGDYDADNGTPTSFMPANSLVMVGDIEGVRAFGAIKDNRSLQAVPMFPKTWSENDPSVDYILLQSAPLMVPTRINACAKMTVI